MNSNTIDNTKSWHDLSRLSYLQDLFAHRRVLIVSNEQYLVDFLVNSRARHVCAICDTEPATPWIKSTERFGPELEICRFDNLHFRDGMFDVAIIPNLAAISGHVDLLSEFRRVVGRKGIVVVGSPNPMCEHRLDPEPNYAAIDYYQLYDVLSESFPSVQMVGQAPFMGYAISNLSEQIDSDGISFDAGLLEKDAEEIEWFLSVCAENPVNLESYSIVQIPLSSLNVNNTDDKQLDVLNQENTNLIQEQYQLIAESKQFEEDLRNVEDELQQIKHNSDQNTQLSAEIEQIKTELHNTKLETGTRGVKIESLQKDLENEKLDAEAARDRAVKISKQFDDERKATQAKQLERQMSKQGESTALQTKITALSSKLRQSEARAESAESSRDEIIGNMRKDSSELSKLRDKTTRLESTAKGAKNREDNLNQQLENARVELRSALARADEAEQAKEIQQTLDKTLIREKELKIQLNKTRDENKNFKHKIDSAQNENKKDQETFQNETASIEKQLSTIGHTLKLTDEELLRRESLIRDLTVRLKEQPTVDNSINSYKQKLDKTTKDLFDANNILTATKTTLKETMISLKETKNKLELTSNYHIVALEKKDLQIASLEGNLQAVNWKLEELETRLNDKDKDKDKTFTEAQSKVQSEDQLKIIQNLADKNKQLEDALAAAMGSISGHHRAKVEANLELATAATEKQKTEKELSDFIEKTRELEDKLAFSFGSQAGHQYAHLEAENTLSEIVNQQLDATNSLNTLIETNKSLEQELKQKSNVNSDLQIELEAVNSEHYRYREELSNIKKEFVNLTTNRNSLLRYQGEAEKKLVENQVFIRTLESDFKQMQNQVDNMSNNDEQIAFLKIELKKEHELCKNIEQKLAASTQKTTTIEQNIVTTTKQTETLQKELEQNQYKLKTAEEKTSEYQELLSEKKSALETVTLELTDTKKISDSLSKELKQHNQNIAVQPNATSEANTKLKTQLTNISAHLKAEQTQRELLENKLQILQTQRDEEFSRTGQAGADAARMAGDLDALHDTLEKSNQKSLAHADCALSAHKALKALRQEISEQSDRTKNLKAENQAERTRVKSLLSEIKQLVKTEANLKIASNKTKQAQEESEHLKKLLKNTQVELKKEQIIKQIKEQNATYNQSENDNILQKVTALESELESMTASLNVQKIQLKDYSENLADTNNTNKELEIQLNYARQELQKTNDNLDNTQVTLKETKYKLEKAKHSASQSTQYSISNAELAQLRITAARQSDHIRKLSEEANVRNPLLESLTSQLEEREHRATTLERKLKHANTQISEQANDSTAWDMELKFRDSRITQLLDEIAALNESLHMESKAKIQTEKTDSSSSPMPQNETTDLKKLNQQIKHLEDTLGEKENELSILHSETEHHQTNVHKTCQTLDSLLSKGKIEGSEAIEIHDILSMLKR